MEFKGIRTIAMSFISTVVVPPLIMKLRDLGIELSPEQQLTLGVDLMAGLMFGLRMITSGPVGGSSTKAAAAVDGVDKIATAVLDKIREDFRREHPEEPKQETKQS